VADNAEYREKLKEKLLEEVKEFCESESIEELADILEVIDAISNLKKFAHTQIQSIRTTKIDERGAFTKKIIMNLPALTGGVSVYSNSVAVRPLSCLPCWVT